MWGAGESTRVYVSLVSMSVWRRNCGEYARKVVVGGETVLLSSSLV